MCLPAILAGEGLNFLSPLPQAVAAAAQAGLLQQQAELERKAAELEKKERELQSSAASINREYRFQQHRGSGVPGALGWPGFGEGAAVVGATRLFSGPSEPSQHRTCHPTADRVGKELREHPLWWVSALSTCLWLL